MEEQKNEKLPVVVKDRSLQDTVNNIARTAYDLTRKGAKVIGAGALGITLLGASTLLASAAAPVAAATTIASIYTLTRAGMNAIYKTEPSLMFMSRKGLSGERKIYQDTRVDLASKMTGYKAGEKAGMMGLQTLVGFSRYKESLKGTPYTEREDGSKVYIPKYSTVTHTVNLKNFRMLEQLGLIEIESMDDKFKKPGIIGRAIGAEPKGKQSLLLFEKLGFRNFADLGTIAKAFVIRDKDTLDRKKVDLNKVTFRLTDKPIDFEDMYLKVNGARPYESKEEQVALRRFLSIFGQGRGILGSKPIDIGKDVFERDIILYGRKENFATRMRPALEAGQVEMDKTTCTEQEKSAEKQKGNIFQVDKSVIEKIEEVGRASNPDVHHSSAPEHDEVK